MTHRPHRDAAIEALAAREYERAGDAYTRAGRAQLADPREDVGPFDGTRKGWVGRGLASLAIATVAYRVAGADRRGTHRAVEGVAVTRDLETALDRPPQRGCLAEFVADFRLVGDLDGIEHAYDEAARRYRENCNSLEEPTFWTTTPLFEAAASTISQAARGTADGEIAVSWEDLHGSDPAQSGAFLARRVQFKRRRFRSYLDQTLETGTLAAPRGTTEYDNDTFWCRSCERSDVNWTGDSVLCLRCSRPVEERET